MIMPVVLIYSLNRLTLKTEWITKTSATQHQQLNNKQHCEQKNN